MKPSPWPGRKLAGAVFAAALLLYLSWRSLYFNFDGVACAIAIDLSDFKHLVHGNHLAYGVVGWLFNEAWRLLGYRGPALLSLQILDGILGAAGAAMFALLLRRSGRGEREAALGAACLAVSAAWWFWSLEAQVYMLGAFFAALAAHEALAEEPCPTRVGLWHAGAALAHVGHVMALPALAWALARKKGRHALGPYLGALTGILLTAYAAAGLLAVKPRSMAELKLWLLGSAALGVDRAFSWHGVALPAAVMHWTRMTLRIFCEFYGRSGWILAAGVLLALLPLAAAARGAWRGESRARFWLLWLAGYAALFLNWEPFTIVYRVVDLLGIWALALIGLEELPVRTRTAALAAWVASAGAYNLAFVILPAADPASNKDLVEARWVAAHAPEDAWIMATARGPVYFPYFAHRRPLNLRYLAAQPALLSRLDALAARGEEVAVTGRTLDLAGLHETLSRYGLEPVASDGGETLYRVRRAASPAAKARRN